VAAGERAAAHCAAHPPLHTNGSRDPAAAMAGKRAAV